MLLIDPDYFAWPQIPEKDIEDVCRLLRDGRTSMAEDMLYAFEQELAARFQVSHALLTCNGTSAAFCCYHALGLKPGDEVIGPALTHWATLLPAVRLGCRVVFADSERESLGLSLEDVLRRITPATRAVVVCHAYGNPVDVAGLREVCIDKGLFLLEDLSHAPGALLGGKPVGSFGHMSFMSMQANKLVSGGEGGVVLTDDPERYARAMALGQPKRLFRLPPEWAALNEVSLGFKFRISALHALLARRSHERLDAQNSIREEMFRGLLQRLGDLDLLAAPHTLPSAKRVWWEYDLLLRAGVGTAQAVAKDLRRRGVFAGDAASNFLPALPQFEGLARSPDNWPEAARHCRRALLLAPFKRRAPELLDEYAGIVREAVLATRE